MKKYNYDSDIASLKIINKETGESLFFDNGYDGTHEVWVFDSPNEFYGLMEETHTKYEVLPMFIKNGWAISNYDCSKTYNKDTDEDLDSDFIRIAVIPLDYGWDKENIYAIIKHNKM